MKKYLLLSFMLFTSAMNIVAMEVRRTCELCFEEKAGDEFKPLSCCGYNVSCTECLVDLINTSLQEKTAKRIVCPNRECLKPIALHDMYAITDMHTDVYDKFLDVTVHEHVVNEKYIKHCPTPDCPYSFINDRELKQAFDCPKCQQTYCSMCLVQHGQMTCEQAKKERELTANPDLATQATQKWIADNTKECPSCHKPIQKNGGCNHMTCKQCNHQFCWTCGATYRTTGCNTNYCATNNAQVPFLGQAEGLNVNNNVNPLMYAAQNGHLDIVRLLLQQGANIDQVRNGMTALDFAIQNNNDEVVRALIRAGANPLGQNVAHNVGGNGGRTLLELAIHDNNPEMVRRLLQPIIVGPGENIENIVNRNGQQQANNQGRGPVPDDAQIV